MSLTLDTTYSIGGVALGITGKIPQVVEQEPPDKKILPGVVALTLSGQSLTIINTTPLPKRRKGRRRRPRYLVEIDGQFFDADSPVAVRKLLEQAAEIAEAQADSLKSAPVVRVKTGTGKATTSKPINAAVRQAQRSINRSFDRALAERQRRQTQDREIALLLALKLRDEEDDDEALLALLL